MPEERQYSSCNQTARFAGGTLCDTNAVLEMWKARPLNVSLDKLVMKIAAFGLIFAVAAGLKIKHRTGELSQLWHAASSGFCVVDLRLIRNAFLLRWNDN